MGAGGGGYKPPPPPPPPPPQANLLGSRGSPSVNPASENPVVGVNIF